MKLTINVIIAFVVIALFAGTAEASIAMISAWAEASVSDDSDSDSDIYSGTTIPSFETLTAALGGLSSTITLDRHQRGGQTIFSFGVTHQRIGDQHPLTDTSVHIRFIATSSAPYELSGFFNATDYGAPGDVMLHAAIFDVTIPNNSSTVFQNWQESQETPNEQFVVGESGGDYVSILDGSATGTLIENHIYDFWAASWTSPYPNTPDTDSGVSGEGNVTLKIGVIPEPSSLALVGVLLFSLCASRRGTRR